MLDEERKYKKYIEDHLLESKKSALNTTLKIQRSELNAGGANYTRTLQIPKFFTQEDKCNFEKIVKRTYAIFAKVIEAYRKDIKIRQLFPFSKELEELILLKPRYEVPIPICRVDIFYDEETKEFSFCEFNTDGTSAMNENKRLYDFLSLNNVYKHFDEEYEYLELVDAWVKAFIETCQKANLSAYRIGIVDFLDKAYLSELYVFERVFKERGIECEVVDIRDLDYKNHKLVSKNTKMPIDVIYRRAVTKDVMDHYDEIQPFIQAVKEEAVCLIGAFQTQLVHHKDISQVLMHPYMQTYLSKEEVQFLKRHLPATYDLNKSIVDSLLMDKNHWIIKPKDSYAAKGVWAGVDLNENEWKRVVEDSLSYDYIAQVYIPPYKSLNIDLVNYDTFQLYSNLTGLYVYNGEFKGVYSRMSDSGIISTQYNEKTVPTLFLKD